MRINCFGCSHTNDFYDDQSSWPKELSKMYPQHIVYNYSLPGSSSAWSLFCMRQVKKQPGDINIYQSTSANRVTTWIGNPLDTTMLNENNYYKLGNSLFMEKSLVKLVTPSVEAYKKFRKFYFDFMTEETSTFMHTEYLKSSMSLADYSFAQLKNYNQGHDCFIDEIGKDRYMELVCDGQGMHLNSKGAKIQAEWIAEKLGDKLNVE